MTSPPTSPPARHAGLLRMFLIVMLCISVALLLSVDSVFEYLQRLLVGAEPYIRGHPVLGPVLFVVLSAISAILAFFSSALLVPAAVFAWGNAVTVFLLWLGWLLGGMFAFALGRGLRSPQGANSARRSRLAAYLPRHPERVGFPTVLLWQLALPSEVPGYLCGYLGVRFRVYLPAVALGELPYAAGAVLLGESVIKRELGSLVALGALGAIVVFFGARALRRRNS